MGHNAATADTHNRMKERQEEFLSALRGEDGGAPLSIRAACDKIGIRRWTVKNWRQTDPEFLEKFEDAFEDGTDTIEDTAVTRALDGEVTKREFDKETGEVVSEERRVDNSLLKFLLAGRRPERYREGTTINNMNAQVAGPVDDAQIARALSLILAQAKQKQLGG